MVEQTTSSAAAESPAFLRALTEMAQQRPITTSRAIYNHQGIKLLEGGVQIDASLYDRLLVHRLAVPLDESVESDDAVTGAALREAAEAALARWPFFALMAPAGRVRSMLLQSIEAIPLPQPVALHLTLARETRPGMLEHGILMALLCAHLVREGGAPIYDMTVAASAGLLHDLGMLHIDAELLDPANTLSGDARRPLYAHPVTGSMLITRFHEYPLTVARAVLEHHERLDGSGYPRALVGAAISPLGRLLSLCEVVTAMFDGERERPEQRVSLLLRVSPRRFDPALVPSIHRLLRALPPAADALAAPVTASIAASVASLRRLGELIGAWQATLAVSACALDKAGQAVLGAVAEQAETLQRMLFEAGVAPAQLDLLGDADDADPANASLGAELWALSRELQWHLRAGANQLRMRWRASRGAGGPPFPPDLARWLDAVESLEAPA